MAKWGKPFSTRALLPSQPTPWVTPKKKPETLQANWSGWKTTWAEPYPINTTLKATSFKPPPTPRTPTPLLFACVMTSWARKKPCLILTTVDLTAKAQPGALDAYVRDHHQTVLGADHGFQ